VREEIEKSWYPVGVQLILYGFARPRDRSFADSPLDNPFNLQRHLVSRSTHRIFRSEAAAQWRSATIAA
jgi:hypothetical protein